MGNNSEDEVNDWVDGWEPALEWAGEEESKILSESDGSTANSPSVDIFVDLCWPIPILLLLGITAWLGLGKGS